MPTPTPKEKKEGERVEKVRLLGASTYSRYAYHPYLGRDFATGDTDSAVYHRHRSILPSLFIYLYIDRYIGTTEFASIQYKRAKYMNTSMHASKERAGWPTRSDSPLST